MAKFRLNVLGCWLIWCAAHVLVMEHYGFPVAISVADSLVTNGMLLNACWLASNVIRFYPKQKDNFLMVVVLSLVLSLAATGLSRFIFRHYVPVMAATLPVAPDIMAFHDHIELTFWVRWGMGFLVVSCMSTISLLWYAREEETKAAKRSADTERLTREAELYNLRQQLQPHFLFNSLNSISALVGTQPAEARKMIQQLSDFLRGTVQREKEDQVTLEGELHTLELYLNIEKLRFGYRLNTVLNREENCLQLKLPPMILQPVVENAIKFGLYDTTEAVTIGITATCGKGMLSIRVENPFDPQSSRPREGTGFGLNSINRRLYLLFARNDLVETIVGNDLFTTIIHIPQPIT